MHKKSELENMSQEELMDIAKELGIQTPGEGDRMGLIYQIIDEESIQSASQKAAPAKTPPARTRGPLDDMTSQVLGQLDLLMQKEHIPLKQSAYLRGKMD